DLISAESPSKYACTLTVNLYLIKNLHRQFINKPIRSPIHTLPPLFLNSHHCFLRIKAGRWNNHRCTMSSCGEIAHDHAKAMVVRYRNADPILVGITINFSDEKPVIEDIAMR